LFESSVPDEGLAVTITALGCFFLVQQLQITTVRFSQLKKDQIEI